MKDDFDPKNVTVAELPPGKLFGHIVGRLRSEKGLSVSRKKVIYFSLVSLLALAAFLLACAALQSALVQSELIRVLSLIFSDPKEIVSDWQNFGMFVLESMPVFSISVFFVATFIFLASLRYIAKNVSSFICWSKKITKYSHGYK